MAIVGGAADRIVGSYGYTHAREKVVSGMQLLFSVAGSGRKLVGHSMLVLANVGRH